MKHLYPLLLFTTLFIVGKGQSQPSELSVEAVHITADSVYIPAGITSSMALTIRNEDSLALEPGDTINTSIWINGMAFHSQLVLDGLFNPFTSITHNFGASNLYPFPDSAAAFEVIGIVSHYADTFSANDTLSTIYYTDTNLDNDWACTDITILSPANLDSFDLDNGTNTPPAIDHVQVELTNHGVVTYLQWTSVHYALIMSGDTTLVEGALNEGNIAPTQSTIRNLSNQALFPPVPVSVGTYSLCAISNEPYDVPYGSDSSCTIFTLIDSFDPTDPANWPFGIEEGEATPFKIISASGVLRFEEVDQQLSLKFFDVRGSLITETSVDGPTSIQMNTLARGLYVVHITSDRGEVWATKVMLH